MSSGGGLLTMWGSGEHAVPSHAVTWQIAAGPLHRGRLELAAKSFVLAGRSSEGHVVRLVLPYADVRGVRLGGLEDERVDGRRSLVIERTVGPPVLVAASGGGALLELLDLLASLVASAASPVSVAVVVPLRRGARERAQALIGRGPPFDPAHFNRHYVYLTTREAVFVFEGEHVRESLEQLASRPALWREAAEWAGVIGGRPRLADEEYRWTAGGETRPPAEPDAAA
jgi:hypothetical protein